MSSDEAVSESSDSEVEFIPVFTIRRATEFRQRFGRGNSVQHLAKSSVDVMCEKIVSCFRLGPLCAQQSIRYYPEDGERIGELDKYLQTEDSIWFRLKNGEKEFIWIPPLDLQEVGYSRVRDMSTCVQYISRALADGLINEFEGYKNDMIVHGGDQNSYCDHWRNLELFIRNDRMLKRLSEDVCTDAFAGLSVFQKHKMLNSMFISLGCMDPSVKGAKVISLDFSILSDR